MEPKQSRFGFRLAEDVTSTSESDSEASGSEVSFTKRIRKQLERLLVFYYGEVLESQACPPSKSHSTASLAGRQGGYNSQVHSFTKKEQLVLRQTVRLAGISVTYFSCAEPQAQSDLVRLIEYLTDQVIEMKVEKKA